MRKGSLALQEHHPPTPGPLGRRTGMESALLRQAGCGNGAGAVSVLPAGAGAWEEALDLPGLHKAGTWDDKGAGRRAHGSGHWLEPLETRELWGRG